MLQQVYVLVDVLLANTLLDISIVLLLLSVYCRSAPIALLKQVLMFYHLKTWRTAHMYGRLQKKVNVS